jgi:hypothetical protein
MNTVIIFFIGIIEDTKKKVGYLSTGWILMEGPCIQIPVLAPKAGKVLEFTGVIR